MPMPTVEARKAGSVSRSQARPRSRRVLRVDEGRYVLRRMERGGFSAGRTHRVSEDVQLEVEVPQLSVRAGISAGEGQTAAAEAASGRRNRHAVQRQQAASDAETSRATGAVDSQLHVAG